MREEYTPRRLIIRKENLERYGYTVGCPECRAANRGLVAVGRTEACRKRFLELYPERLLTEQQQEKEEQQDGEQEGGDKEEGHVTSGKITQKPPEEDDDVQMEGSGVKQPPAGKKRKRIAEMSVPA